jgi:peptidoglycan/xylan/chitin deacetylase (PgdA/CDA1 family)
LPLAILCYHRLIEEDAIHTAWPYLERGTAVRISNYRAQLRDVSEFADIVPEQVALDALAERRRLSRPAVWLTFDDGYRDVLNALGPNTTGTIFPTTCVTEQLLPADEWYDVLLGAKRSHGVLNLGHGAFTYDLRTPHGRARLVNGPERRTFLRSPAAARAETLHALIKQLDAEVERSQHYLTHGEIQRFLAAEWTLGSHGTTHTPFDAMEPENVAREAFDSLGWLSDLGAQPRSIALPDGSVPNDLVSIQSCGYECILGLGNEPAERGTAVQSRFIVPDDPHWVRRVLKPMLEGEFA